MKVTRTGYEENSEDGCGSRYRTGGAGKAFVFTSNSVLRLRSGWGKTGSEAGACQYEKALERNQRLLPE